MPFLKNLGLTLEMIKWEHSIFALPFALCGAMLAAGGWPRPWQTFWIVVCMVTARSAAMTFNRLVDAGFDAVNPRTAARALPAGKLSARFARIFIVAASVLFVVSASQLNRLALMLSPAALSLLFLYSYTKRWTRWSHVVLGFCLGIAPVAAWISIRGSLDWRILLLTAAVTFWVGGFDVLYACQDYDHDRQTSLFSIPKAVGVKHALLLARLMHVLMLLLLIALVYVFDLRGLAITGVAAVAGLLLYEHSLVSASDLSRLNAAFFTLNGVISVIFFCFIAADLTLHRIA
jgi:4-hydroxybenzoate polyprenyltransferase